jgi:hypothetical protein
MPDRKKAEAFILQVIKEIDPSGENEKIYKEIFSSMSDKDFDEYMKKMENEEAFLTLFIEHFNNSSITTENNIKVGKKHGIKFFHKLTVTGDKDLGEYTTPIEYMLLELPVRRQSQNLVKKISIPEHNRVVDTLTGQPTGDSKGAKISYPELQVLTSMGLENSLVELFKYRGGDSGGFNAYNQSIMKYGETNLKLLNNYATGVVSSKTLKAYLLAIHTNTNL